MATTSLGIRYPVLTDTANVPRDLGYLAADVNALLVERVGASVTRTAAQSIASATQTSISWDTETSDAYGFIAAPSATLTVPSGKGGLYAITFRAVAALALAGRSFAQVTAAGRIYREPIVATDDQGAVGITVVLAAADTVTAAVYHSTGTSINFTGSLDVYRVAR